MAKFSGKNIEFRDYQKAVFGDGDDSYISWNDTNAELTISTVVSGVYPTDAGHLTTKYYVDQITDHGNLTGLGGDDHLQYVPRDGSRGFTSTVSGVTPVTDYELTTKEYVDTVISGAVGAANSFLALSDTPTIYSGSENKYPRVKEDGTGLYFENAIVGVSSSGTTPPEDSNLWYNNTYNEFFYYDPDRGEWLSMTLHNYLFTYQGAIDGLYLSIGNVSHADAHYYIPRPATITAIVASAEDKGEDEKTFELRDGNDGNSVITSFITTAWSFQDMSMSVNMDQDTQLKVYATSAGQAGRNPIITVEVRWRYEVI